MGIAVVVVMLAILNIAVLGSVAASGDESNLGAMRLETTRAFYAAETGAVVVIRHLEAGIDPPPSGTTLALGAAQVEFVQIPLVGESGDAVVIGTSGFACRRVKVSIAAP